MMFVFYVCCYLEYVQLLHVVCRSATFTCSTFFAVEGFSVVYTSVCAFFIHVLFVCRGKVVLALAHFVAGTFCTILGIHFLALRLLKNTGLALSLICILLCISTLHAHRTCMFDIHF